MVLRPGSSHVEGERDSRGARRIGLIAFYIWIFLPLSPVQRVATGLGRATSPLLKEESDVLRLTLIAQFTQSLYLDRACSWSAFASCDYPVNIRKVHRAKRVEQRLE